MAIHFNFYLLGARRPHYMIIISYDIILRYHMIFSGVRMMLRALLNPVMLFRILLCYKHMAGKSFGIALGLGGKYRQKLLGVSLTPLELKARLRTKSKKLM